MNFLGQKFGGKPSGVGLGGFTELLTQPDIHRRYTCGCTCTHRHAFKHTARPRTHITTHICAHRHTQMHTHAHTGQVPERPAHDLRAPFPTGLDPSQTILTSNFKPVFQTEELISLESEAWGPEDTVGGRDREEKLSQGTAWPVGFPGGSSVKILCCLWQVC